eukprot:12543828-Alexandrium_andersonii.AAC.1
MSASLVGSEMCIRDSCTASSLHMLHGGFVARCAVSTLVPRWMLAGACLVYLARCAVSKSDASHA